MTPIVARRRYRVCLAASIPAYLGGAGAAAWWLPGQPLVAYVLAFFAAHSAAYLLTHLVRGDDEAQIR